MRPLKPDHGRPVNEPTLWVKDAAFPPDGFMELFCKLQSADEL